MIGVVADSADQEVVREFFELFKTPWEFYRGDRRYDVLVCDGDAQFDGSAKIVLVYGGRKLRSDDQRRIQSQRKHTCIVSYQGNRIPIYGDSVAFEEEGDALLTDTDASQCVAYLTQSGEKVRARIGYDLFGEVRALLKTGQPPANAEMPALELHIAFLRDLIIGCGVPMVEIPAVPAGYEFIACLTHDVDHPSIRQHKWDHTAIGFLYRATIGSLSDLVRGRMGLRDLLANLAAALKLPLVHLGLAKDFWREFDKRYLELEDGVPSTFFVIPFRDRPGNTVDGPAPAFRAARYGARDLADSIKRLRDAGCEVGLHGIDAWLDDSRGREELKEIRSLTESDQVGARMHWLYYGQQSPQTLESAGAEYDSTIGFNGTAGYRAGTTQVYKPLHATRLLELPMHVMDTALFYPAYLGLTREEAGTVLSRLEDNAARFGGCLTINWHDRSVAPERLWGACYRDLLQDLKHRRAWFSTAGQAVSWFRKRRSVVFETDPHDPEGVRARVEGDHGDRLPGLRLRIHKARDSRQIDSTDSESYVDLVFDESIDRKMPYAGELLMAPEP